MCSVKNVRGVSECFDRLGSAGVAAAGDCRRVWRMVVSANCSKYVVFEDLLLVGCDSMYRMHLMTL